MPVHSHGEVSHDHPDDDPGHTHDTEVTDTTAAPRPAAPPPAPTVSEYGPTGGGVAARVGLTLLGAAALIVGAFLQWVGEAGFSAVGTEIEWRVFFSTEVDQVGFLASAGFIVIIIGGLALLGLAPATGWLTRLAGALGILAFILVLISLYRADGDLSNIRLGLWLVLVGGVVGVIAGFFGSRMRTITA